MDIRGILLKHGITEVGNLAEVRKQLEMKQLDYLDERDSALDEQDRQLVQEKILEIEEILYELPLDEQGVEEYINEGFVYQHGLNGEEDFEKAVSCYEKAISFGSMEGKVRMAHMYEWGLGVEKDLEKARALYEEVAAAGSEYAATQLKLFDKRRAKEQADVIQNRYYEAVLLQMTGKMNEAVALFKELAEIGSDMAVARLKSLGIAAGTETVEAGYETPQQQVPEVKEPTIIQDSEIPTEVKEPTIIQWNQNQEESVEIQEEVNFEDNEDKTIYLTSMINEEDTAEFMEEAERAVHKMLSKGQSQRLRDMEDNIRIKNIENRPVVYVAADAYCERREVYESRDPSYYVNSTSEQIKSRVDYDLWNIEDSVTPIQLFEEQHNDTRLRDSLYLEGCNTCGCVGTVPCTNCYNGTETCPDCYGSGSLRCGSCGGSGEVECSSCYGYGYHEEEEQVGCDQYNSPIYARVKKTCYSCGGSGRATCGRCGGYGNVTCDCCGGAGEITCRVCHGTRNVTCSSCQGYGYFLNFVNLRQDFARMTNYMVTTPYQIRQSIYGTKQFAEFELSDRDLCISSITSEQMLPRTENLSVFDGGSVEMLELMQEAKKMAGSGVDTRILQYRARVCMRNVLDITYEFDNKEYNMLLDTVTGQTLVDVNPYEHVADFMIGELEELREKGRYKTFLYEYEEFKAITDSEDVNHDVREVISIYKSIERRLMVVAGVTTGILYLLPTVFSLLGGRIFAPVKDILFLIVAMGLPLFLTKKFWGKVAQDKERVTEIIIGVISAVIAIVLFNIRF